MRARHDDRNLSVVLERLERRLRRLAERSDSGALARNGNHHRSLGGGKQRQGRDVTRGCAVSIFARQTLYAAFRCARRKTAFAMYSASLAAPWIIVDDIA